MRNGVKGHEEQCSETQIVGVGKPHWLHTDLESSSESDYLATQEDPVTQIGIPWRDLYNCTDPNASTNVPVGLFTLGLALVRCMCAPGHHGG